MKGVRVRLVIKILVSLYVDTRSGWPNDGQRGEIYHPTHDLELIITPIPKPKIRSLPLFSGGAIM